MLELLQQMPNGVRLLLGYGFALMAGLALTLPRVIEQAVEAPISAIGLLWMLLLAYVIFTLTLILQRKRAGWGLTVGLATLSLPLVALLYLWGSIAGALVGALLVALLFLALSRRSVRAWFSEQ